MAVDKLVDSTQLDADLTSVADAIRQKTGGATSLQFPADFIREILTLQPPIVPQVETLESSLSLSSGATGVISVRLDAQPSQNWLVSVFGNGLTVSPASITFDSTNWNVWQPISVTAPSVESTTEYYVSLINSDKLLTETSVLVSVKALSYEDLVDTTIPTEGMHTVTLADFDYNAAYGNYIRLGKYNGSYTNIKIPSTIDGKIPWILCDRDGNAAFTNNTTIQYVTFEDGVIYRAGGTTSGCRATFLFSGCTALIGVSNMNPSVTDMGQTFNGCTNFRFVDNLDELTSITRFDATWVNSGIEYIQDLSNLVNLSAVQAAFRGATHLIKIFGMPHTLAATGVNATNYCSGTTALTSAIVPAGVSNLAFAFYNDTALRKVEIYEDNLTTSGIVSTTFSGCRNLTVYCNAGTTTHESLLAQYGSSTNVTIKTFGGTTMPSIVVWGDSISSPNKAWIEWPKRLQTKLGTSEYLIKNEALAGEGSISTTVRQGGLPLNTDAFTIPADTTAAAVTLRTTTNAGTETFGGTASTPIFSAGASFNPCSVNGVSGVISRSGTQYYFTRLAAGSAVNVSANSSFVSDKGSEFNAAANVMIFYLNGNAGWSTAEDLLYFFQEAVDHFTAMGGTKYIVTGPAATSLLDPSKYPDQRAEILRFEPLAAAAFGSHWFNLREYEIQNGLTQNNLTASALDTERMANGLVPASLVGGGSTTDIVMYDGVNNTDQNHPNVYGSNTIMLGFYEKGVALGYWS